MRSPSSENRPLVPRDRGIARYVIRGAAVGVFVAAVGGYAYNGMIAESGHGRAIDVAVMTTYAIVPIALLSCLFGLAILAVRRLPAWTSAVAIASLLMLFRFWGMPTPAALRLTLAVAAIEALAFGSLVALWCLRLRGRSNLLRIAFAVCLVVAFAGNVAFFSWLVSEGTARFRDPSIVEGAPVSDDSEAPDPSQRGAYSFSQIAYGSGLDVRRPEYGSEADLSTRPVDATPFFEAEGIQASSRRWYWGFDFDSIPLNGYVWCPDGAGEFPLVLIVHGNSSMTNPADRGFAYLGEHLASRGFIVASLDERFFGNHFLTGGLGGENDARGWLILKHLEVWHAWNDTPENPFFNKVDTDRIALIGHSSGGEAVAIAAAFNRLSHYPDDATIEFDFDFGIKSVAAIAPADGHYEPADRLLPLENVNYFLLQGSHDADMSWFAGIRQYQRLRFTDGAGWFKAMLFAHSANHGQFNTEWGAVDVPMPQGWFLNTASLMTAEDQRRVAMVYLAAFCEATLHDDHDFMPILRDHRAALDWLPKTRYLTQYRDATFSVICDFEEDVDVTTTSLKGGGIDTVGLTDWREQGLWFRNGRPQENHVVMLGWAGGSTAELSVQLPPDFAQQQALDSDSILVFNLADARETGEMPIDLTVELTDSAGRIAKRPLSDFSAVERPFSVRFTKFAAWESRSDRYENPIETVLQTFELPLAAYVDAEPGFHPVSLVGIRFRFDRMRDGAVYVDDVGFARRR